MSASIMMNPLILGCFAGIIYSLFNTPFPEYINNTFNLFSSATLPLALISIGAAFKFTRLKDYLALSVISSIFKLVLFPVVGYYFLNLFHISGIAFKTGMIFFVLPTATSIYVLSSQLNSNTELASPLIVMSTVFSFISLSIVLIMF